MKIYHFFILLFFSTPLFTDAQQITECGSEQATERLHSENPLYARQLAILERKLIRDQDLPVQRDGDICVIPVVVHVIHNGEAIGTGTNISDAQIHSAIVGLNEDFRKEPGSNGDGDGVDIGIEFCLASRSPEDNSTTGIVRVNGSSVPNYAEQGVSLTEDGADEESVKALSRWPREDYLNIWIVNEIDNNDGENGVQGFAYLPTTSSLDGIVNLYNAFGTVGNLKSYTNMNRTITHEVGHYLGLYHTFHQSTDCEETNCETQGDRVCDTPVTVPNPTCSLPACSGTQLVENYMDYTFQTCKDMFTEGQKVRMRYNLFEARGTLLDSQGCVPPTLLDASISGITSPSGSLCSGTVFPEVTILNMGSSTLTSATINYSIDNNSSSQFEWTGSLTSGQSESVVLPISTTSGGNHIFYASTSSPNGSPDEYDINDGSQSGFLVTSGSMATVAIDLDLAGSETSWQIKQGDVILGSGGPYNNNSPGFIYEQVCLGEGCYDFIMLDEWGDGLGYLSGSYGVSDGDGEQVIYETNNSQDNFGSSITHEFCMGPPSGEPTVTSFSASNTTVCAGESINFTDTSSEDPTGWSWQFTGASPSSSSQQNPSGIMYNTPGTYAVSLTTSNNIGGDTETIQGYITVQDAPEFSISSTHISCNGANDGMAQISGAAGMNVNWSNGSSGNSISELSAGNYSVTVSSSGGCSSTDNFTIAEPAALNVSVFKSDVSCFGLADGSASATASGGTQPYSFNWSNGASSGSVSGLDQGVYDVTVTDASGCTNQENIAIIQPSEIVLSVSNISPETCVGSDGFATANALGGTGSLSFFWSNESTGQNLSSVAFGTYEVTVTDNSGCTATEAISIPFDCDEMVPTTQLIASDCNKSGFTLSESLLCNEVPGAEMYLWNFSDVAGVTLEEAYTLGNNNSFLLSELTQISYGQTMNVKIKVQKDNEWGEWGSTCSITTLENPASIDLIDADCNAEIHTIGNEIQAEPNSGAEEFEWMLSHGDSEFSIFTYVNVLTLGEDLGLPLGQTISVRLRVRYGDAWSLPGNSCSFIIDQVDSVGDAFGLGEPSMTIYPNPNNGEYFSLDLENLPEGTNVIHVTVYNSAGKRVMSWTNNIYSNTHISETYSFNNKLSKGMYLIQVDSAGYNYQQKLIVR
ncbi:MAG: M43 family zinc metalloprotease [Flavobacteriales bacterium]